MNWTVSYPYCSRIWKNWKVIFGFLFLLGSPNLSPLTAQTPSKVKHIKLLFVGDIMGHGPQIRSAERIKNESYDYEPCFRYVRPLLQSADLTIGNLEVTLPGKPPYQGWPNFKSPDDLAKALRDAGFDLLTTANNHSNDAGKNGVIQTINTLQVNGFYNTGTYRDSLEKKLYHPLIVYKKGFKLAFLNYTYGTDQKKHRPPTVVNLIDEQQIKKDLKQCQQLEVDATIVLLHWGKEYQIDQSEKQQQLARRLARWGADVVIGNHPHVVQGVEEYFWKKQQAKEKEMSLLAYSLGNFISNQQKKYTDGGIILGIDLVKTATDTQIEDHYYLPVWRFIRKNDEQKNSYHCVPISAYENQSHKLPGFTKRDLRKMRAYAQFIRQHLNKSDCPERPFSY